LRETRPHHEVIEKVDGNPYKGIWVFGDLRNERLFGLSLNVLSKARELAQALSGKTAIVLLAGPASAKSEITSSLGLSPHQAAGLSLAHGADFVYLLESEQFIPPRADIYGAAMAQAIRIKNPSHVLFPLTDFSRELAARASRLCNAGLISECVDLRAEGNNVLATCPAWGGDILADITFVDESHIGFATVQAHAFQALEGRGVPGAIERIPMNNFQVSEGLRLVSSTPERPESVRLEDAAVVVVGGAGVGSAEGFDMVRDLAVALDAEVGATRPPVLQHWIDEERLVGQTGKKVRPQWLVSIGTSGAIQYTAGITEAENIVAINRDQRAPIFQVADIGVVADIKSFLPLFTNKAKQVTMQKLADVLYTDEKRPEENGFGEKVRRLREKRGWSLEALARETGQSPEFVDQVEKEHITPPVGFLLELAKTLGVDPGMFLREEHKTLIRNLRTQAFVKRTRNYSYETLSAGGEKNHLMAFTVTIEPEQAHKPVAYKHDGEEFIFVMEGDLQLMLGSKPHHLKPGESIHFNANTQHKLKSTSKEPTRCLVVLYTP
jgi:electron transfer flavoprotein alpha subunit